MWLDFKKNITRKIVDLIGGQRVMTIQMDITNACNLSCAHCYHSHHNNKGAIKLDDWFEIIDQYKQFLDEYHWRPKIVICGGEPTVSPYLLPLISKVDSIWPGVRVSILTNGTRLTEKLLDALSPYNIEMQISLDGPDAEKHDLVRGKGAFEKALTGLKLAASKGVDIYVQSILSKKTSSWLEDFFRLARALKVRQMNFTRFISQGTGIKLENSGEDRPLLPQELKRAMEDILRFSKKHKVPTNTNQALFHLLDEKLGANEKYGYQGLIVDYMGNLKVSSRADYIVGNVLEEGLKNLFLNDPIFRNLRKANIETCGQCQFFRKCGGSRNASFATTGSFLKADPGCWIR